MPIAAAAVEAHGGEVEPAPHPIGPHGQRGVVRDPEGTRVALHAPA